VRGSERLNYSEIYKYVTDFRKVGSEVQNTEMMVSRMVELEGTEIFFRQFVY
jgi:hypothetical protein